MWVAKAYHARVSAPSASDTFNRVSLVEEIHQQQQRSAQEESQRREREEKDARSARRKKVRNWVLVIVAAVVVLGAVAYGVKQFVETRRVEQGLASAAEPLAASSVAKLEAALTQHLSSGHFDVVNSAYAGLAAGLPAKQDFTVQLAIVRSRFRQIVERDNRLLAQGFDVDAELDPQLADVLLRVYELSRNIPEEAERLTTLRKIVTQVADHYAQQEMFAVVEQALAVKADEAVPS